MHPNEQLIRRFYTAFQERDAHTMIGCYAKNAVFRDPVFSLDGRKEIAGMWIMLNLRAKDLEISFRDIEANDHSGRAVWEARYTFSRTGRVVFNQIQAQFTFQDGLILKHEDHFDFWKWSRQALGFSGYVLGWSGVFQAKVQSQARKALNAFLWGESELLKKGT